VSAESIGKTAFLRVACPREAQLAAFEPLENPGPKTGLEPCKGRPSGVYVEVESEFKMGIPANSLMEYAKRAEDNGFTFALSNVSIILVTRNYDVEGR
jgi:hypothetical protein